MTYVCPKCSLNVDKSQISGQTALCTCGNVFAVKIPLSRGQKIFKVIKYFSLLFLIAGVGGVFIHYKKNYFSASTQYLLFNIKNIFAEQKEDKLVEMGRTCNSSLAFKCSVEVYRKLFKRDSNNFVYAANYIYALYETDKHDKADKLFDEYSQITSFSYDLYYAKAKSLNKRNLNAESISNYYTAINYNPYHIKALNELSDLLIKERKYNEAYALLNHHQHNFNNENLFKNKINFLEKKVLETAEQKDIKNYSIVAVRDHFFIPIQINNLKLNKFLIDTGASNLTLNTVDLKRSKVKYKDLGVGRAKVANDIININRVLIPELTVGPWKLKNVEALHCDSCSGLVGMNILSKFNTQIKTNNGVSILKMSKIL